MQGRGPASLFRCACVLFRGVKRLRCGGTLLWCGGEGALYPPCPQCPYKNSVMLCAQLCGLCLCVRTPVGCAAGAVSSLLRAPTLHSEGLQLQGRHMRRAPSPMRVAHLLHWQGGATVLYTIYICTVGGAVGGMRAPCAPSQPGYAPVHAAQCMVPNSRWWHMGMGVLCTLTTLCCIAVLAHGNEVISSLCWHMAVYARGRLLQAIPGWGAVGAWVVAGRQHSTPPPAASSCSSPGMMQGGNERGTGGSSSGCVCCNPLLVPPSGIPPLSRQVRSHPEGKGVQ